MVEPLLTCGELTSFAQLLKKMIPTLDNFDKFIQGNKITIWNNYALPLTSTLFEHLTEAKYFTKLNLRGSYNLVWICLSDEWNTTFTIKMGILTIQIPSSLMNVPLVFQYIAMIFFETFWLYSPTFIWMTSWPYWRLKQSMAYLPNFPMITRIWSLC